MVGCFLSPFFGLFDRNKKLCVSENKFFLIDCFPCMIVWKSNGILWIMFNNVVSKTITWLRKFPIYCRCHHGRALGGEASNSLFAPPPLLTGHLYLYSYFFFFFVFAVLYWYNTYNLKYVSFIETLNINKILILCRGWFYGLCKYLALNKRGCMIYYFKNMISILPKFIVLV